MAPQNLPPIKAPLARTAPGEGRVAVSVGRAMYGHVKIRVHPGQPGSGFVFENSLVTAAIPDEFIQPIAIGLEYSSAHLGDYCVDDVRVELVDAFYHDINSSAEAFILAGARQPPFLSLTTRETTSPTNATREDERECWSSPRPGLRFVRCGSSPPALPASPCDTAGRSGPRLRTTGL